jgi:hypothetical protein
MPNGDAQRIADLLSTPLEQLLVALGSGIGRAQAELDRHSIQTQAMIDEHEVLSQYGLEATWYQIPSTQLELKMSVAMEQPREPSRAPAVMGEPLELGLPERLKRLPRLWAQPASARFVNQFGFDVQAASTVTLQIVAVPPPGAARGAEPSATRDAIVEIARPHLLPKEDMSQPPSGRVTINFNPGARAWYVVQSEESEGTVSLRVLLKIDDETRAILKHEEREE